MRLKVCLMVLTAAVSVASDSYYQRARYGRQYGWPGAYSPVTRRGGTSEDHSAELGWAGGASRHSAETDRDSSDERLWAGAGRRRHLSHAQAAALGGHDAARRLQDVLGGAGPHWDRPGSPWRHDPHHRPDHRYPSGRRYADYGGGHWRSATDDSREGTRPDHRMSDDSSEPLRAPAGNAGQRDDHVSREDSSGTANRNSDGHVPSWGERSRKVHRQRNMDRTGEDRTWRDVLGLWQSGASRQPAFGNGAYRAQLRPTTDDPHGQDSGEKHQYRARQGMYGAGGHRAQLWPAADDSRDEDSDERQQYRARQARYGAGGHRAQLWSAADDSRGDHDSGERQQYRARQARYGAGGHRAQLWPAADDPRDHDSGERQQHRVRQDMYGAGGHRAQLWSAADDSRGQDSGESPVDVRRSMYSGGGYRTRLWLDTTDSQDRDSRDRDSRERQQYTSRQSM